MKKNGELNETSVPGKDPDADMIEVADTAMGFPRYVTSLAIKPNDKPVEDRYANEAGCMGPRKSRK